MPSDMWVHELWAPYVSPLKSEDSKLEGFFPLYSCFWWRIFFFSEISGQGIRESDEGDPLLLQLDAQHQREQDLQVHHGQALQPAVDGGAQPHRRRAHHRLLKTLHPYTDKMLGKKTYTSPSFPPLRRLPPDLSLPVMEAGHGHGWAELSSCMYI